MYMNEFNNMSVALTEIHSGIVVEVFKTNVHSAQQAGQIIRQLQQILPEARINFDLEDCDKILRIATPADFINVEQVVTIVNAYGCSAEVLL
jgi:hypothetical protein